MKTFIHGLILLLTLLPLTATAQKNTLTQELRKNTEGEGSVVIVMDDALERIINNTPLPKPATKPASTHNDNSAKNHGESHSASVDSKTYKPGSRKRYKTSGYRIRIFTGGNSKKDKEQAQKVGEKCRKQFPELSVYTHFVSPRWVCTVGDFKTMEDAKKYITPIRPARITYEVRVVKSEVFLVE